MRDFVRSSRVALVLGVYSNAVLPLVLWKYYFYLIIYLHYIHTVCAQGCGMSLSNFFFSHKVTWYSLDEAVALRTLVRSMKINFTKVHLALVEEARGDLKTRCLGGSLNLSIWEPFWIKVARQNRL